MDNPRIYGTGPFGIAVLHGGPGAPGEMAPVARQLAAARGVLEPLQTADSINGQIRELAELLAAHGEAPFSLVGWSWGAWLGLIFAARYPALVDRLIMVGSPPFEERYAPDIMATRLNRLPPDRRSEFLALVKSLEEAPITSPRESMQRMHEILLRTDCLDPLPHDEEVLDFQYGLFRAVWGEAAELRSSGELLKMGQSVRCRVVALHGDYDPHPAEGVRGPLSQVIRDFEFVLLARCGHYPWFENAAWLDFFSRLNGELQNPM